MQSSVINGPCTVIYGLDLMAQPLRILGESLNNNHHAQDDNAAMTATYREQRDERMEPEPQQRQPQQLEH